MTTPAPPPTFSAASGRFTIPPAPGHEASAAAIEVRDLTKTYRGFPALNHLDLTLPAGRITGLMGPNGCGKTTLLKILAGVLSDYSGTIRVAGHAPGPESKARVAYLPDAAYLPEQWRVDDAIAYFARYFGDFDTDRADALVRSFDLPRDRTLKEMSKGMGEKLRIALTMARRASVYLLDEPVSGVDPAAREVLLDGIIQDFDPEALLLISTHLITDVEPMVDSVVFLNQGRLLLAGDADDLRAAHGNNLDALFRKEFRS